MNKSNTQAVVGSERQQSEWISLVKPCLLVMATCGLSSIGCRTSAELDMSLLKTRPPVETLADSKSESPAQPEIDTSDVQGPLQRRLAHFTGDKRNQDDGREFVAAARSGFEQAQQLYQDGDREAAQKILKRIRKKYKTALVREDVLYLLSEIEFEQGRYTQAQDTIDTLIRDFPATRYVDNSSQRLFAIARKWLGSTEVATGGDIQPVSFENRSAAPRTVGETESQRASDPTLNIPILPNFHDRSRPVFDTRGRALQALKSIWLNDPTGPLADDALMLTASYYLRRSDFVEADRYFEILREEYPQSPHLKHAFVLGSHSKLMSYQGAVYDGTSLDEAQELKQSTLRLYPESQERQRIREELKLIADAQARRDWELVEFYRRKNRPQSMAVYCLQILENHPNTGYAGLARETLEQLGPEATAGFPGMNNQQIPKLLPVPQQSAVSDGTQPDAPDDTPGRVKL
ncbi:MAG: outer membrane protein assembly factor BamD [Planctomycetaceae bacterium]